jgi:hypothetical protein
MEVRVSDFYRSDGNDQWLKAADLDGPTNFTIASVDNEHPPYKEGDPPQMVLYFANHSKKLGLNWTNATAISNLLGDDNDGWAGRTITLYVEQNIRRKDGTTGPGIRVIPILPGNAPRNTARPNNGPLPTPPHVRTQNIVNRQQRQAPPPQSQDDYGADYDPLA